MKITHIRKLSVITDRLEHFWEERFMQKSAGWILVIIYLGAIGVIELNRQGFIGGRLGEFLPNNHFYAVQVAFTLLLFTEVVSLIFGLSRSFSRAIGIQFEILSLIFLRDTFKRFTTFSEPLDWDTVSNAIGPMIADAAGALLIFVVLGIYYRQQRRRPITDDELEQKAFIEYKKLISLGLLVLFIVIGLVDLWQYVTGGETYPFFDTFYTVLIFTDVLMVLLSLRYTSSYGVVFRNFGYAVVTVFIRIALIAPIPLNVGIGVGAALFALGISFAYNRYGSEIVQQREVEEDAVLQPSAGD